MRKNFELDDDIVAECALKIVTEVIESVLFNQDYYTKEDGVYKFREPGTPPLLEGDMLCEVLGMVEDVIADTLEMGSSADEDGNYHRYKIKVIEE